MDDSDDVVVISAADAREISRLLGLLLPRSASIETNDNNRNRSGQALSPAFRRRKLLAKARAVYSERNRRAQFFSKAMFGEPAWDILLSLYIIDGRSLTIGRLVNMVGAPQTTALRWLDYLERENLIARRADSNDRRVVCIDLLERGCELLDSYFTSMPNEAYAVG